MQPVAVVTGASSGIGAATAIRLAGAGAGYHVILTARRADRIDAVAGRIRAEGGSAQAGVLDVTDRAAVDSFAGSQRRRHHRPSGVARLPAAAFAAALDRHQAAVLFVPRLAASLPYGPPAPVSRWTS
jgi:NAD(P)-dependent dehydrogenase (short-subunit alcohol dehydrogenase family)